MSDDRKFLVYTPSLNGVYKAQLFGENRNFDVAINNYCGNQTPSEAEYHFHLRGHKWPSIKNNLQKIPRHYKYYAFLDEDIEISTHQLNSLFLLGEKHDLSLFQPALSEDSFYTHPVTVYQHGAELRFTKFVEIMMPVFRHNSLLKCKNYFDESELGWGLDFLFAKLLEGEKIAVVDAIVAKHLRPMKSEQWRSSSNQTPVEEMVYLANKYNFEIPPWMIERYNL